MTEDREDLLAKVEHSSKASPGARLGRRGRGRGREERERERESKEEGEGEGEGEFNDSFSDFNSLP